MTTCPDCKGKGYIELFSSSQPCNCRTKSSQKENLIQFVDEPYKQTIEKLIIKSGPWDTVAKNVQELRRKFHNSIIDNVLEPFIHPETQQKLWNSIEARHAVHLDCMEFPVGMTFYTKMKSPSLQEIKNGELNLEIVQKSIVAITRRLQNCRFDSPVDNLIVNIAQDIDNEIFGDLICSAEEHNFVDSVQPIRLSEKILNVSAKIYKRNLRGPADVAYMSTNRFYDNYNNIKTIQDRIRVIPHNSISENKVLIACHGSSFLDVGYLYNIYMVPYLHVDIWERSPPQLMMRYAKTLSYPEKFHVLHFEQQK